MYFKNINNKELQLFHGFTVGNFCISLSDILSSVNLFYIETMISNRLYKIYPLFYTKNIASSNPDDEILDNKCIICSKQNTETYFTFINNPNEDVISLNTALASYKTIGDELETDLFNAIVQAFRTSEFTEEINIVDSHVYGKYGEYIFDFDSATIVDNGVLISTETISNLGTVQLLNPAFKSSSYLLSMKVYSSDDENIVVSSLNIPLIANDIVTIPFDNLELNNVVGFDATVNIVHDIPVISFSKNLSLKISGLYKVDEVLTLTARYTDDDDVLSGSSISFYDDNEFLGTATTNEDGIAIFEYTPLVNKYYKFNAKSEEDNAESNQTLVEIAKNDCILTIEEISRNRIAGTLKTNTRRVSNKNINLHLGSRNIEVTTDNDGEFIYPVPSEYFGDYVTYATFAGDSGYNPCTSNYLNSPIKLKTKLTDVSFNLHFINDRHMCLVVLSGYLKDYDDNPLLNKTINYDIKIKTQGDGNKIVIPYNNTVSTHNLGFFGLSLPLTINESAIMFSASSYTFELKLSFEETDVEFGCSYEGVK